jgi:O-antigen/teichoic acid export membrane protein
MAGAAFIARRLLLVQVAGTCLVAFVGAAIWSRLAPHDNLSLLVAVAVLAIPQTMQSFFEAVIAASQRFVQILGVAACSSAVQVLLVLIAAILRGGAREFILANLGAAIVAFAVGWKYCRPIFRFGTEQKGDQQSRHIEMPRLWAASAAFYALWLLDLVIWDRSEVLFLRYFSDFAQVAFYGLAFGIAGRFSGIADTVTHLVLPMTATAAGEGGLDAASRVNREAIRYILTLIIPLCWMGVLLARPIVLILYGPNYEPVSTVLEILLFSLSFTALSNVMASAVFVLEQYRALVLIGCVAATVNIALNIFLVPRMGATGAAVANASGQILSVAAATVFVSRSLPGSIPWALMARTYGFGILSAVPVLFAVATGVGKALLVTCVLASIVAYCYLQFVSAALNRLDLMAFKRVIYRTIQEPTKEK